MELNSTPKILMAALLLPAIALGGGICNDRKPECGHWAKENHCVDNPEYMNFFCPLSCQICNHTCADVNTTCVEWAKADECDNNAEFMLRNCPTSCGLCTPECKDTMAECAGWAHLGEVCHPRKLTYARPLSLGSPASFWRQGFRMRVASLP